MMKKSLVVVGGGAAGYFGAIAAAEKCSDLEVSIIEASQRPLTKVKISGGGRCNVTHHCFDVKRLTSFYPRGRQELLGLFHRFQPKDTLEWFAQRGVELKVEADGRMFPTTDSSDTIINCLQGAASELGVQLRKGALITAIHEDQATTQSNACSEPVSSPRFRLDLRGGESLHADAVLWTTGSLQKSYQLIEGLGHHIVAPVPSLFTFQIKNPLIADLAGQSFPEVQIKLLVGGQKFEQVGPLLVTHWGLSGPAVLKLSAFAARELHGSDYQADLQINFAYPAKQDELIDRLIQLKTTDAQKALTAFSPFSMSRRFWRRCLECSKIDPEQLWGQSSHRELRNLANFIQAAPLRVQGKGVFKEEFVTCGGVDLKEVNFKTMESKICPGLYFAGEVLNIDGITGGFNFQNAWTTSWVAAQAIAARLS